MLSPDGRHLVIAVGESDHELWVRPLDQLEGTRLAVGAGGDAPYQPFFSPDGEWIGYVTAQELKKVPVTGGAPITLTPVQRSRGRQLGAGRPIVIAPSAGEASRWCPPPVGTYAPHHRRRGAGR